MIQPLERHANEPGTVRFESEGPTYKVRARSPRNGMWVWLSLNDNKPGFDPHNIEEVWAEAMTMVQGEEPPAEVQLFEIRMVRRWKDKGGITL